MTRKSTNKRPYKAKNRHQKRNKKNRWRRYFLFIILAITLTITGFYISQKIFFYYSMYFKTFNSKNLTNSKYEEERIKKIVTEYNGKTFGIDISHYQRKEDIVWDSLSIANGSIPIEFILLRATMGKNKSDNHFEEFWEKAKKHKLIRGAYHFYRPDEDPVLQANNFLNTVKLEEGDLAPVLDIEKRPRHITEEQLIENLKIWCKIVENAYGIKPIIYTYYFYHKDHLKKEFEGYPLWLANYNDVLVPSDKVEWKFWQFTEKGIVKGIKTKVDVNVYNGSTWSLKDLTVD